MAADLRCASTWPALAYARSRTVHAAATAGLDVIDVPYLDLDDLEGMRREAEAAAELGFVGKGAIHPKQIPILNAIFTPDEAAVERARRIVAAFEEGDTGLLVIDGKLIERPVLALHVPHPGDRRAGRGRAEPRPAPGLWPGQFTRRFRRPTPGSCAGRSPAMLGERLIVWIVVPAVGDAPRLGNVHDDRARMRPLAL